MDDLNLTSSQESLLPFSQETYNYFYNILAQDGSGQLIADLNDLTEIVPDPPQVPVARSCLPGTKDWPGDVGFKVTFGSQDKTAVKNNVNWVYSDKEKKLYVKRNAACPINFSTSFPMPSGVIVRAMAFYTSPEHVSEVVTRCLNCSIPELEKKIIEAQHLIRSESSAAKYNEDISNKRHSVVIPFQNPPAGHSFSTYIYKFACFNSCAGGPNRRSLTLVFTLEQNNTEIGRCSFDLKICACPGRDSGTIEKPATSCSTKRKMEPEVLPKDIKAMLPGLPKSNLKPKKKSIGKQKEFSIETNDFECYKFLREMKKMYHFNQKMSGLPKELNIFFQLLRSSSSEDERSQDEENGAGTTMTQ